MSRDGFYSMLLREQGVVIGVVRTSDTCRKAQDVHDLSSTACIALGRLLTATALVSYAQKRRGQLSFQLVGKGQLRQVFADMTDAGALRGYVKNPHVGLPLAPGENPRSRIRIGHALGEGSCSMIREPERGEFVQSATELKTGEIDEDVESSVGMSEQIVTSLTCDVLLDDALDIRHAGGLIIQPLPHGDVATLEAIAARVRNGGFAKLLDAHEGDVLAVVKELAPDAESIESEQTVEWKCRCSEERVRSALHMLTPHDLSEMIGENEPAKVTCDFCNTVYLVNVEALRNVHDTLIATRN
ncbi:MAG: Hsp33 family molecular chaperone HslO [Clostridia bacterium]|nr:Hsp33 family molecular chaperone HslO [Deltaproteobacteria bacterium]